MSNLDMDIDPFDHDYTHQPDVMLPSQWFDRIRASRHSSPEQRLAWEVLIGGLDDIFDQSKPSPAKHRAHHEAVIWLMDERNGQAQPYDFDWLCEFFELDALAIRSYVRRWLALPVERRPTVRL